eukprot:1183738-Prorocentrum_minimum.AAC.1
MDIDPPPPPPDAPPPREFGLRPRTQPDTKDDSTLPEGEYHVERIVQHKRGKGKKLLYEVKWLNYNDHDNTWEPGENIYEYCLYEYWSKGLFTERPVAGSAPHVAGKTTGRCFDVSPRYFPDGGCGSRRQSWFNEGNSTALPGAGRHCERDGEVQHGEELLAQGEADGTLSFRRHSRGGVSMWHNHIDARVIRHGEVSPVGLAASKCCPSALGFSSQVVGHLLEMFETTGWVPELLGYDDGCHLHGFIHRPERVSEWAANPVWQKLLLMHIFIDRFHFPNHVDTWCKANMSAD